MTRGTMAVAETTKLHATAAAAREPLDGLLERAKSGDMVAFDQVYRRFQPDIQRYIQRRTGDPALAADLTSDVFVSVLEAVQQGRPWRESFTSWLYRIAQYRLIDHIRRVARRAECGLLDSLSSGGRSAMDDHVDRSILADNVRAVVGELKPEQAQILRLRFNEDLPHADVARLVGKNANAVKVAQFRALRRMKHRLQINPRVGALAS